MLGTTVRASDAATPSRARRSRSGVEVVATVLCIRHDVLHPTINYEEPDPECDLDYVPNTAREVKVNKAMSNSFGFGGHNASIIFRKL